MQGAKPNIQIVKEVIQNWKDKDKLKALAPTSTIGNVKCTVRAIVRQYVAEGLWDTVPKSLPYNTKGAVLVIQESYEYLIGLYDNDVEKFLAGDRKPKKIKPIDKYIAKRAKEEGMKVAKETNLSLELAILVKDIVKYTLTREQITEQLFKLTSG